MRRSLVTLLVVAACSKSPTTPPTTPPAPATPTTPDGNKPSLTAAACEAQGGKVVGDIGDGAIHQPDYRCPDSGEAPIASVAAAGDGGPVAIEGAVCCK